MKGILIALVLVIILFAIVWIRKMRRNKAADEPKETTLNTGEDQRWGTCKKCGERRIILKEGLCAFCWSSSQTKGAI